MTVSELIALLQRHPPTATVVFHDGEIAIDDGDRTLDQMNETGSLDAPSPVVSYTLEQIRMAFLNQFHGSGEWWFSGEIFDDAEVDSGTVKAWTEFVEELKELDHP